ncbi:SH3 domain-containing protein [Sulfurimonas sp. SAG-AH-194-L11]|nr:SH3 domain-containing C40 family peptidase [Sulfurimonas sp. SAG-AH-194-L11]MDF1877915.1 SH3 domain-containing protein [Sulfurimonas sp. SAG-AH-194-L11]
MKFFYLICVLLLLNSCSVKDTQSQTQSNKSLKPIKIKPSDDKPEFIADLKNISQDVSFYTKNIQENFFFAQEEYEKQYFKVWNLDKVSISLQDAKWAHRRYKVGDTYGENLQLHTEAFFRDNLQNANYEAYQSINKKALTLVNVNLRAFPTNKPVLKDPKQAGEGFPFDYLQNSSIAANKPLIISHYSKNKKWAFVESSFAFGWVKSRNIVIINDKYTKIWQKAQQVFIVKEGVPIYSQDNEFLFKSRIGMILPLVEEDEDFYTVLTLSKYKNKKPLYIQSKIEKTIASRGILKFNAQNINMILKEVSKTNYGWGGIFAQRDCSSTLRDFYAPFGLWLPRNSSKQSSLGKIIKLEGLSNDAKLKILKKEGLAFRTLVYKQGHIALYVGEYKNQAIIFQNVWGVKTKKDGVEGRFIIGRPIFSTLEVGKNLKNFDTNASMLINLKSISIL